MSTSDHVQGEVNFSGATAPLLVKRVPSATLSRRATSKSRSADASSPASCSAFAFTGSSLASVSSASLEFFSNLSALLMSTRMAARSFPLQSDTSHIAYPSSKSGYSARMRLTRAKARLGRHCHVLLHGSIQHPLRGCRHEGWERFNLHLFRLGNAGNNYGVARVPSGVASGMFHMGPVSVSKNGNGSKQKNKRGKSS